MADRCGRMNETSSAVIIIYDNGLDGVNKGWSGQNEGICCVDIIPTVRYISEVLKYQSVDFGRDTRNCS
jgi:hypothetical protein